ncbi:hypothetical protein EDD18DRAFT_1356906 [Armillaria luteobubalina]|uniref:Uncharacterized protein n=1 Tax=Armillaria luteobubalina TaxID=153913 RepID=A0AA39PZJ3_9AGAR|nr:hypothetical protein EDD18DRAFT_1356906 [Armillaria luteobubalina]
MTEGIRNKQTPPIFLECGTYLQDDGYRKIELWAPFNRDTGTNAGRLFIFLNMGDDLLQLRRDPDSFLFHCLSDSLRLYIPKASHDSSYNPATDTTTTSLYNLSPDNPLSRMPSFHPGAFPPVRQRVWAPGHTWNAGDICVVYYMDHGRQMVASFRCLVNHISDNSNGPPNSSFWQSGPLR